MYFEGRKRQNRSHTHLRVTCPLRTAARGWFFYLFIFHFYFYANLPFQMGTLRLCVSKCIRRLKRRCLLLSHAFGAAPFDNLQRPGASKWVNGSGVWSFVPTSCFALVLISCFHHNEEYGCFLHISSPNSSVCGLQLSQFQHVGEQRSFFRCLRYYS